MRTLRRWSIVSATLLVLALASPLSQRAAHAAGSSRALSGELVVTNAARNQFRLVGHGGEFTAPAGTSLEALDGKAVEVELAADGRVRTIAPLPIHIEPVVHDIQTASGELVVRDAVNRTFTLAGDDRVYVAPSYIDLRPYAGRMVELRLDEDGQVTELALSQPAGVMVTSHGCAYETETYADGATRCEHGQQFVCTAGEWRNLGTSCVIRASALSPRSCMFGGATVAAGSSICRSGTAYRCADGEWINLGTSCR